MDEKRAQIEIAALGNASQPNFAARAALSGHQAHKRGKFAASTEPAWPSFATSAVALSSPMPGSSAIAQQGRQQRFEFRRTIADLLQAGLPSAFEHHAKLIQQAPQLVDLGRS